MGIDIYIHSGQINANSRGMFGLSPVVFKARAASERLSTQSKNRRLYEQHQNEIEKNTW
jgi:hypothetical protein